MADSLLDTRSRIFDVAAGLLAGLFLATAVVWAAPLIRGGDPALERGDLVILSGRDDGVGGQHEKLVNLWNATIGQAHGITARIEALPGSADDHYSEMKGRAESAGGTVDIYNLDVIWIAEFAANRWIQPLDESIVDTSGFIRTPLDAGRYDGRLWALPFNTDAGLLFYRTDLVGTGLPPMRWRDLSRKIDEAFDARTEPRLAAGYVGQLDDYEGLTVNALEAIWDADGEVVEDGKVVIDRYRQQVETGLAHLANARAEGERPLLHPDAVRSREGDCTRAFREGTVAFMRNWPVAYRNLTEQAAESRARPAFSVTRFGKWSVLGGQSLAIAAGTDQPAAARSLVEFLTSPLSGQILFERGGFAATHAVIYKDEKVRQTYPYAEVLLQAVETARPRPVTPHYALFSKTFRTGVRYAMEHNGKLPGGFAEQLAAALDGRLLE